MCLVISVFYRTGRFTCLVKEEYGFAKLDICRTLTSTMAALKVGKGNIFIRHWWGVDSSKINPIHSINDCGCSRVSSKSTLRCTVVLQGCWLFFLNWEDCSFVSTLFPDWSVPSPLHFQGVCETSDRRSVCPLCLKFLSDVVVWCFSQWLSKSDLQGHEGPHRHMEEDLPHVSQFIQIHVGQTDQCKCQEGLTVPPDREVCKQVALIQTGCCAEEEGNHIIKVFIVIL